MRIRLNSHEVANPVSLVWIPGARTSLIDTDRRIGIEKPIAGIGEVQQGSGPSKGRGELRGVKPVIQGDLLIEARSDILPPRLAVPGVESGECVNLGVWIGQWIASCPEASYQQCVQAMIAQ